MSKRLLLFLFVFSGINIVSAQQAPQYSLYMMNPLQFNPAYAGMESAVSFTGVYRKQWVNLDGSPAQQSVTAHMPLYFISSGLGLSFDNDELGARRYSNFKLHYNYQLPVGPSGILSGGLNISLGQFTWNGDKLRTPDGIYTGGVDHMDDLLPSNQVSASTTDIGAGLYYQDERIKVGISANNLLSSQIVLDDVSLTNNRQYFFYAAYDIQLSRSLEITPTTLVKSDFNEYQVELSAILRYNGNVFGGISYRGFDNTHLDGIIFLAGFKLGQQTTLGYAYDLTLSPLRSVSNGSHEIVLNYRLKENFGKGKLPKVIYNPRFL
ncbi:MAG: type IX secretion system membrane protein PorP/SprF [Saprospiraceae bacterium]|nr:type IX secretion system membrane protein PorP/SprF [Saprospiraceae bacterium]